MALNGLLKLFIALAVFPVIGSSQVFVLSKDHPSSYRAPTVESASTACLNEGPQALLNGCGMNQSHTTVVAQNESSTDWADLIKRLNRLDAEARAVQSDLLAFQQQLRALRKNYDQTGLKGFSDDCQNKLFLARAQVSPAQQEWVKKAATLSRRADELKAQQAQIHSLYKPSFIVSAQDMNPENDTAMATFQTVYTQKQWAADQVIKETAFLKPIELQAFKPVPLGSECRVEVAWYPPVKNGEWRHYFKEYFHYTKDNFCGMAYVLREKSLEEYDYTRTTTLDAFGLHSASGTGVLQLISKNPC